MPEPWQLPAAEAVARLARRELTSEALTRSLLERIDAREPSVGAWEHLDRDAALAAARAADAAPRAPLFGLPVGVKDIVDTADLPTACGSAVLAGRRPEHDAACVARLRAAGAVILGKTVTTEFAFYGPGKTANPHDPSRTPGGSSSGSAAAVADGMVPAALGSQTAGSIIRPASFCGAVGLKPSFGVLPLEGVHPLAPSLDTLGLFTRRVADLTPLLAALGARVHPPVLPAPPRVGLCRTPRWREASPGMRAAIEAAARALAAAGARVEEVEVPGFEALFDAQRTIMAYEAARALAAERAAFPEKLSAVLTGLLEEGDRTSEEAYDAALSEAGVGRARVGTLFAHRQVLLTPSAPGEAPPRAAGGTGDPLMNRVWTLLGLPCLSLPGARGDGGLPLGIQLVGPPHGDPALLAVAAWCEARLAPAP